MTFVKYKIHHFISGGKDVGERTVTVSDRIIVDAVLRYCRVGEYCQDLGITLIEIIKDETGD